MKVNMFQFLMVQLKEIWKNKETILSKFQFLMVQLKEHGICARLQP